MKKSSTGKILIRVVAGVFVVALSFVFVMPKTYAVQNPSYIMPDSVFVNSASMSEQQIQNFLASRGSYLANYTVPAAFTEAGYYNGTFIGPIGSEVDATGWRASKVIYMASQWYGINPQVTMATLFKEQSWITSTDTASSYSLAYRLRWAMGYAVTESGVVNVCSTSTNHNPSGSCAGFAMQVDWGAGGLKFSYNGSASRSSSVGRYWAGNTISLDGVSVYLGNNSTAALYRYTPHTPYSYNYVWFFNTYFTNIDYTGAAPVYRFWNLKNGTHFYTISESEKKNVVAKLSSTYKLEGISYYLNYGTGRNTTPLYRFYNLKNGTHFYTASETEKNNVVSRMSGTYRLEGVAWYVSINAANATPVYRFWNTKGTHFYTANPTERDNVITRMSASYKYEGIAYYIPY